jgi:gamma-glutamylaminecyclotransferase
MDRTPVYQVFVYGTLKQGFRNHAINRGVRRPGGFTTVEALPLYIVGERFLPWLLNRPGQGFRVHGELYDCDAATLDEMDRLEGVGTPGWYGRQLWIRPGAHLDGGSQALYAWVYFGSEAGFARSACHFGPIPEYTQAHAREFVVRR